MKLPDLPPALDSDLQSLVRRLLTENDFTAIEPIIDELQALGRISTLDKFEVHLASALVDSKSVRFGWWGNALLRIFWFDLFDRSACIRKIADDFAALLAVPDPVPGAPMGWGVGYGRLLDETRVVTGVSSAAQIRADVGFVPPVNEDGNPVFSGSGVSFGDLIGNSRWNYDPADAVPERNAQPMTPDPVISDALDRGRLRTFISELSDERLDQLAEVIIEVREGRESSGTAS